MNSPPLDPRVLANVARSYEGETLLAPECDVPVYHGKGRLEFKTGFTYVGDFVHGRMHGTGRIEWHASGVAYEGDFTHNEITGRGTYWWPNGSSYVGDVKRGKRHGRGVFVTGDRGVPKPLLFAFRSHETEGHDVDGGGGDGHDDAKGEDDVGLVMAQSNARYDGEWENGLPHGCGELVFDAARNIRYEGQFVEGKREGKGHMHYAYGSVYVGDWKADVKCGQGVMTWMTPRGDGELLNPEDSTPLERYDGEWLNDYQEGFGRHVWLVNPLSVSATGSTSKNNWYEGEFHEGLRHGRGVFFYANGARYEGEWKTNVKEGYGLFFYEDGRVFVGLFRQDRSVEGSYATASTTTGGIVPVSPVKADSAETNVASTVISSSQPPSSSSSVAGIMLFINDLLPISDIPKREKARKAVEHAALRINTELRALYRGCIKESRRSASSSSNDPDESGTLLEVFECRQLLSQCGFYFTSGQLESLMQEVRRAQRSGAMACAASMNIAEYFLEDLPVENRANHPLDPTRLEIVPWDEVLLFREFVELFVRIAHSWVMSAEAEGIIELAGSSDSTVFLADIFSDFYEQIVRERQEALSQSSPSWLALLRAELMGKNLHIVFTKHHDQLQSLYSSCAAPSVRRQHEDAVELDDGEEEPAPTDKYTDEVSVRSVLVMLRNQSSPESPIFTADFQVRHALAALNRAFTASAPSLKPELHRSVARSSATENNQDGEPDAFFMSTTVVFSEFLDAIAIVLFTKQHMKLESAKKTPSKQQSPQELPLHVLVDQFMQTVKVNAHPLL
ncbi:hypothetical protein PHYSODRAFT_504737 [Phytophthora sojae]|uniref:Radial spoke head 10 family protein n=1 Tax=Phytophthora sojae (strain P6497) TaxID=1094619 RepID=G4ZK71_PHYSP|nr:hypothetical protein PHYSODRAFT_504737 [Phytophthora sojae]EGZ14875.1 hypothetical protein PHYSODRAFT_504737 [Phytophthora sojae]|eukprot:XP_009528624.1 hypothetical protein PHYSODRAFT_504737 [Phytophthora sojae]